MTAPVVLSREDWGADPVVRSSDGTPRPPVDAPARWLTVHYTGNTNPLWTADRAAVVAAQQGLERFASGAGKPNEYNWCLYCAAGVGYVVEYAGIWRAAHSADENQEAVGVLFWLGVDQEAPDAMVDAYRYLRDQMLTAMGAIGPATAQTPHCDMPGAATPCPGPVLDRWADLLQPYQGAPSPPTVTEDPMAELWRTSDNRQFLFVIDGKGYNFRDNDALAALRASVPAFPERVVSPGLIDAMPFAGTIE